jgi:hypothetical protein
MWNYVTNGSKPDNNNQVKRNKKHHGSGGSLVKLSNGNISIPAIVVVIIIFGIFLYFLISGNILRPSDEKTGGMAMKNTTPAVSLVFDADFDIMEAIVSEVTVKKYSLVKRKSGR